MLSMNVPVAPQINASPENPIASATSKPKPTAGEKQKPATEKFAQVLEREITETSPKQEINSSSEKPGESKESVGQITEGNGNPSLIHPDTAPVILPLLLDRAGDGADANKANTAFLSLAIIPAPVMADPAIEAVKPSTEMLNPMLASPISSSLPASPLSLVIAPLSTADNKPVVTTPSLTNPILLQKPMQTMPVTNDGVYFLDNIEQSGLGQFLDQAESAAGGKLLPFSPELNEAILANNGDSGESVFSITTESVPNLSLASPHAASSISQHLPAHTVQVDQPLGQPRWNGEFTQKIVWLTSQQHQVAEIHLNPAHLGPVDVMLSITQDQATAQFVSPHLAVREAIEQALPRLREMMAENGIQLGNVMVGAESFQQDNKQQRFFSEQASSDAESGSATPSKMRSTEPAVVTNRHNGIVNTYA